MENNLKNTVKKDTKWKKGVSGNPNGRPTIAEIDKLRQAIEFGEKKYGVDIFRHAVERAFKNDVVLIALLKKIIPDIVKGEGFETNVYNIFNNIKEMVENASRPIPTNRITEAETVPPKLEAKS
ncbi:hypothetical protein M0R04_11785 [Candidatus Dojkabacteria bacterium]|jgi:hypothetical protein|nr:hypothetical protein [Candidatus Dojkabacteria bacterium]